MKNHTGFCDCAAEDYLSAFFFQDNLLEASKSRHFFSSHLKMGKQLFQLLHFCHFQHHERAFCQLWEQSIIFTAWNSTWQQGVLNQPTKSYQLAGIPFEAVGRNLSIWCTQRHWTQSFRYSLVLLSLRLFPKWFTI